MTEERDIIRFALPFAVGIAVTSLVGPLQSTFSSICISTSSLVLTAFLMSGKFRYTPHRIQLVTVELAACLIGSMCLTAAAIAASSSTGQPSFVAVKASAICQSMIRVIDSMPFENAGTGALIKALLTGNRTSLPSELSEAFRESGASHILALSGMHLGIIYGILSKALSPAGNERSIKILRSAAIVASCGIYTIATGAGESMTRAFLFILLNETARLLNRKTSLKGILAAALIIQLATDPLSIRSVSFQLSYAAMAGIAYIHPYLKGFWPSDGKGPFGRIWENASMSISCQITTGPLAWIHFRSFPQNFLIANLIAIPLTGLVIPVALAALTLHAAGICPDFIIRLTEFLVSLITGSLKIIASL